MLRDMTQDEAYRLKLRGHEHREADNFVCPYCGTNSGVASSSPEAAVVCCFKCSKEYFAWTVPGTIHVSAKL
jgi:acetone carboxylase gamma subunit